VTFLFRHSLTRLHPSGGKRVREIRHFRKMPSVTLQSSNLSFPHSAPYARTLHPYDVAVIGGGAQ
jgi:hypothetical protein